MIDRDEAKERAARALAIEQGFSSSDAAVIVGMRSVPVWRTRLRQVEVVIAALSSPQQTP